MKESDLYEPVKNFLQRQGFQVRGEIHHCDLIARRGNESPVVVELKLSLNLDVVLQAVDRTRCVQRVYIAVPEARGRARLASRSGRRKIQRTLKMLGIGLITVGFRTPAGKARPLPRIDVIIEPGPYQPRKDLRRQSRLMREFENRAGDFNVGGARQSPLVTAYRQDALLCARHLSLHGTSSPSQLKRATGIHRAPVLLYRNVYGWFLRPMRGRYALSESGRAALDQYRCVLNALDDPSGDTG